MARFWLLLPLLGLPLSAQDGAVGIRPFFGKPGTLIKSPWACARHGESGRWASAPLPHLSTQVEELTFFHGRVSRSNAHRLAIFQMSTGFVFLAGAGLKPGVAFGATDELGYKAENPILVYDLHATKLHRMGIEHRRLTADHNGLNCRFTGVYGHVLAGILA